MINQEELKKFVSYNPETGVFVWNVSTNGRIKVGSVAGSIENNGYVRLSVSGKRYLAHRLAMIYMYGSCSKFVDHIDGDRANNKIENLRSVTKLENSQNMRKSKRNSSGHVGVHLHRSGKWLSCITVEGEYKYLGLYSSYDCAVSARKNAEVEYGFHENHGR